MDSRLWKAEESLLLVVLNHHADKSSNTEARRAMKCKRCNVNHKSSVCTRDPPFTWTMKAANKRAFCRTIVQENNVVSLFRIAVAMLVNSCKIHSQISAIEIGYVLTSCYPYVFRPT